MGINKYKTIKSPVLMTKHTSSQISSESEKEPSNDTQENDKEPNNENDSEFSFTIPIWLRGIGISLFSLSLSTVIYMYHGYITNPSKSPEPSKLGLSQLFIFSTTGLIFLLTPWEKYKLRIKKIQIGHLIGYFEENNRQIVSTETRLSEKLDKELNDIRKKILEVSRNSRSQENLKTWIDSILQEREFLEKRLLELIERKRGYRHTANLIWSNWCPKDRDDGNEDEVSFKDNNYDLAVIEQTLNRLVNQEKVDITLNNKGKRLYRYIPRERWPQ